VTARVGGVSAATARPAAGTDAAPATLPPTITHGRPQDLNAKLGGGVRQPELAALLAVCVVGAALRFATLGIQSFDYDESYSVGIVLNGSLGHVLHTIPITESSPPLWYVLAWLWSQLFGLGEVASRSFSALVGTALIPVSFLIARRLGSARAGLVAALLVAVNPLLVWYSQEARTYALLALLSALSFWAFVRALNDPRRGWLALWAALSSAALLSHYFAVFLIFPEAMWLIVGSRRRDAMLATAAVAVVGAALVPLLLSQADDRTQWIEGISLPGRIKEVAKKWVTGEIAPTHNWQLAVIAAIVGGSIVYAGRRLSSWERRGVALTGGVGLAALLLPFVIDLAGLHYLISKNVMPAMVVLLLCAALILGAQRARVVGVVGAAVASAFFLAITIDDAVNPALQRSDYRAAAKALGPPFQSQVVVTPTLGNAPLAVYRRGAVPMPANWPARQVVLIEPLPRADVSSRRVATPAPPPGFTLEDRLDARTYSLICYASTIARPIDQVRLNALGGGGASSAQVWPGSAQTAEVANVCASKR
jgi:mannosyltransferase